MPLSGIRTWEPSVRGTEDASFSALAREGKGVSIRLYLWSLRFLSRYVDGLTARHRTPKLVGQGI